MSRLGFTGVAEEIRWRLRRHPAGGGQQRRAKLAPRLVWIFGGGRSGTTWLAAMLRDLPGQDVWFEPGVGRVFDPYHLGLKKPGGGVNAIFSKRYRKVWLKNARDMVLDGALARFPELPEHDLLFIKEPAGSIGAVVLSEATPESAMILLVRDPRDVAASWMDARKPGSWNFERKIEMRSQMKLDRVRKRTASDSVAVYGERYRKIVGESLSAYESHRGRKVFVRYEELLEDTPATMRRIYSTLGIPFDDAVLTSVVERHSWNNIPEEDKGEGKFYRKAKSEGWREDLTEDQIAEIEHETGQLMEKLGYGKAT